MQSQTNMVIPCRATRYDFNARRTTDWFRFFIIIIVCFVEVVQVNSVRRFFRLAAVKILLIMYSAQGFLTAAWPGGGLLRAGAM